MTEFVYKDYLPLNARVIIDYKSSERVKFSYPLSMTYWKAVWKFAFPTILGFWLFTHTRIIFYGSIYLLFPLFILRSIFFPKIIPASVVEAYTMNFMFVLKDFVLPITLISLYFFAVPALVTYYLARDKERLSAWVPKIGYWTTLLSTNIKSKEFTKNDVFDNKVVIPSFSNVYLDYKPNGDFGRHLEKVEILEIPFEYTSRGTFLPFRKKVEKNSFEFRAVFYFSKPIKTGTMKVDFS